MQVAQNYQSMNKDLALIYKMQTGLSPFREDEYALNSVINEYVDAEEVPTPEYLEWLEELALKSVK